MAPVKQVTFNMNSAKNGYIISIYEKDDDNDGQWIQGNQNQFIATNADEVVELLKKALS